MTDERFDNLTRTLGKATSRRTVFKGLVAAAVGGVLAKAGGGDAEARARIKMACARLGQSCATGPGTPGDHVCCPHLACDADNTCCKPANESCIDDGDCCTGNVCRPNPTGLGGRCLPPGDVGADCLEDEDCAVGLTCDPYTGTCGGGGGSECTTDQDCPAGFTCDPYTLTCVGGDQPDGTPCATNGVCASGSCCPPEGVCKPPANASAACAVDADCCGTDVCLGSVCFSCANPSQFCFNNIECCSGTCSNNGPGTQGVCAPYTETCGTGTCPHMECMDTVCNAGTSTCTYIPTSNGIDCGTFPMTCQEGVCTDRCRTEQEPCANTAQCCDPTFVCRPGILESTTRCLPPLT